MKNNNTDNPLMLIFMHIGKLLRDRMSDSLGKGGIHFGQARILVALLHHGELTQGAIAHGLSIRPATVTNLVKKMEASKLIDRKQDAHDDRIMNVTLTAKGKEAANFAIGVMAQIEDEIHSELTKKDVKTLKKPLESVRNALGGSEPEF